MTQWLNLFHPSSLILHPSSLPSCAFCGELNSFTLKQEWKSSRPSESFRMKNLSPALLCSPPSCSSCRPCARARAQSPVVDGAGRDAARAAESERLGKCAQRRRAHGRREHGALDTSRTMRGVRAAYLSVTRGDGGRTSSARSRGRARPRFARRSFWPRGHRRRGHFFTRAIDFGFSKSPEEALACVGREAASRTWSGHPPLPPRL